MQPKVTIGEIFDIYGEQYISDNYVTGQEKGLIPVVPDGKGKHAFQFIE